MVTATTVEAKNKSPLDEYNLDSLFEDNSLIESNEESKYSCSDLVPVKKSIKGKQRNDSTVQEIVLLNPPITF